MGKSKCLLLGMIMIMAVPNCVSASEAEEHSVTAKIPVSCVLENSEEKISYVLTTEESGEKQSILKGNLVLSDKESGYFEVKFLCPDTYHYQVEQSKGSDSKTTYDSTTYNVDVYVTENEDGVMAAEPVVFKSSDDLKCEDCKFENKKEIPKPNAGGLGGGKGGSPVKTGDDTDLVGLITCMLASLGVLIIGFNKKKRKTS